MKPDAARALCDTRYKHVINMANFKLDDVVPWGRSFDEYVHMFSLTDEDLSERIISCGDGPASFNCELSQRGGSIVSVDPIYQFTTEQIHQRINETSPIIIEQLHKNQERFVWTQFASPDEVVKARLKAIDLFLSDFNLGLKQGRYVNAALPDLPFTDQQFDIALCSHFLFLYSEHFSLEFHIDAVKEMLRVVSDVRLFPLLDLRGKLSPHVRPVIKKLSIDGFCIERLKVDYEFQQNGNEMLRIVKEKQTS